MNTYTRLAAVAVVAVVAIGGALYLISPRTGVGGPTAAPTAAPTTTSPVPTATAARTVGPSLPAPTPFNNVDMNVDNWIPYESSRYGFSAKYPPGWAVATATEAWVLQTSDQFWSSNGNGADRFISPGGAVALHLPAFSAALPAGTSMRAWIDAYEAHAEGSTPECTVTAADMRPIDIDGRPGLIDTECGLAAFVVVGDRIFVFSLDDIRDTVLTTFLGTVHLPAAPTPS